MLRNYTSLTLSAFIKVDNIFGMCFPVVYCLYSPVDQGPMMVGTGSFMILLDVDHCVVSTWTIGPLFWISTWIISSSGPITQVARLNCAQRNIHVWTWRISRFSE
jgi:hypothetical protein